MHISRQKLIQFFDSKKAHDESDSPALNAIAGEELGLALVREYFHRKDNKAELLNGNLKNPGFRGTKIDGWLKVSSSNENRQMLYQIEVKNWTAQSKGGRVLALNASKDETWNVACKNWENLWDFEARKFKKLGKSVTKCLSKINNPPVNIQVEPLACFWCPVAKDTTLDPMFSVNLPQGADFEKLWVFSMSLYLRSPACEELEIDLPVTGRRMKLLNDLFRN